MYKKLAFIMTCILLILNSYTQNYNINFTASGASNTVDSVKVENLTQCTSINIGGNDILNLVHVIGMEDYESDICNSVKIFPNPFEDFCFIEFELPIGEATLIMVSDLNGKVIINKHEILMQGKHRYKLYGLNKGIYTIRVASKHILYSGKLISFSEKKGTQGIVEYNISELQEFKKEGHYTTVHKKTKSSIQMQFNAGDVLKLTGKSGIFRTVYMLEPTYSQTVNFTFMACTDNNGNHYSVVKIGDQWWMAENLNAGTYVPIASPQISGTKFCMDVNGQEDPTCPMGGLYEWDNLMQGGSACNGSGAPPNDACLQPVKGLCPEGWHIPSHYEWNTLSRNSGNNPGTFVYDMNIGVLGSEEGGNLKETCTSNWWSPNEGATNKTGFTGLPGGDTWAGVFEDFGQSAYFWTTTMSYGYLPWVYALNYSLPSVGRSYYVRENGFSCRCIKN